MAVTTEVSGDGKYSRNQNNPNNTWSCLLCFALVMTGNRPAHTKRHDDEAAVATPTTQPGGFGL